MSGLLLAPHGLPSMRGCLRSAQRGHGVPKDTEACLSAAMAAAQQGNAEAYQRLLQRCVPVIAATARTHGFHGAAVDDVVQDTLLALHRVRHTYDPARPFLPWLRAIAQRRALDAHRRLSRQRGREAEDSEMYQAYPDPAPSAESGLDHQDRRRLLAEALAALPEAQREAMAQLGSGERSLDQAAAATGRSKGALKVNLHRALKALRARLGIDE